MPTSDAATLIMRLDGPLQAWGLSSRWVVRDTADEPTKSGVVGLLCCALGRRRREPVADLAAMAMAVRVDRPGRLLRDYHTIGARTGILAANGKIKLTDKTKQIETLVSERFYLADAAFLVALSGPNELVERCARALQAPVWPPFLGRKGCPPSVPMFEAMADTPEPLDALRSCPWRPRLAEVDAPPDPLRCVVECPHDAPLAEPRYDVPLSFSTRTYGLRYVRRVDLPAPEVGNPLQTPTPRRWPQRMRYKAAHWKAIRNERARLDGYRCVFCGLPSQPIHHVTYERANQERLDDLRAMCRLCHDAVSMVETALAMSCQRIDPTTQTYRQLVLERRRQILDRRQPRRTRHRRD